MNQEVNKNGSQANDKNSYLQELATYLGGLPEEEKQEALTYYEEYFADAGSDGFARAFDELGAPRQLAAQILSGFGRNYHDFAPHGSSDSLPADPEEAAESLRQEQAAAAQKQQAEQNQAGQAAPQVVAAKRSSNTALIIILVILGLPLLLPLLGVAFGLTVALFAIIFSFFVAALAITFGLGTAGLALIAAAFPLMMVSFWEGLLTLGAGLLLLGLGLLAILLAGIICFKLLPAMVRGIISLFRRKKKE